VSRRKEEEKSRRGISELTKLALGAVLLVIGKNGVDMAKWLIAATTVYEAITEVGNIVK
jgi:hypothetical protein